MSDVFDGHILALINRHARGARSDRTESALRAHLETYNAQIKSPASIEFAIAHIAALPRGSRVIVVGGDGSVHRLLPSILAGGHSMGLIALGSGNDTARALGLHGLSLQVAVAKACGAKTRGFDVGCVKFNDLAGQAFNLAFASSLNAGFDSAVNTRAHEAPLWLSGLPRFLFATLSELSKLRTWSLSWHSDGDAPRAKETLMLSALNTRTFGAGMPIAPAAITDDGRLDVVHIQALSTWGAAMRLPSLLRGTHISDPSVTLWTTQRIHAKSQTPIPLSADGEPLGLTLEWEVWIEPDALQVACG
jgi:diacylglycerol kinase (ATP)